MKIKVTKTIVIYNKEGVNIKEVDVSHLNWLLVYARASQILASSLYGFRWEISVKPKE
jgi:hypothetical protein